MNQYYYIITGLASLAIDGRGACPPFPEFISELAGQLSHGDAALAAYVRHPFDNWNILTKLEGRGRPFDCRGCFGEEELASELKNPSRLPAYAVEFISSSRGARPPFPGDSTDDQLAWAFYEEACAHPNNFLAAWFTFDLDLRNLLAAMNCRAMAAESGAPAALLIEKAIIGKNEVAKRLMRSNAPDFSLYGLFPAAERIIALSHGKLVEMEKGIDAVRWSVLEELAFLTPFGIETILAYIIKLTIVHRWARLDPDEGGKLLDGLIESLRQKAAA